MSKVKIYLDDVRIPIAPAEWVVVKSYDEFVNAISKHGLENIEYISFDHDLGEKAIAEFFNGVYENDENPIFNYDNLGDEKTGMDCAKWLIEEYILPKFKKDEEIENYCKNFPQINIHSANPVGKKNIISYFHSFYKTFNINSEITTYYHAHSYRKFD
jgi:hypothetical protein